MPDLIAQANPHTQAVADRQISGSTASQSPIFVVRGRPGPLDRPALPSGHPESWGAITNGTVLDHSAYPFPVFLDLPQ